MLYNGTRMCLSLFNTTLLKLSINQIMGSEHTLMNQEIETWLF